MATLGRLDWYDIARSTNWTPTYVSEDELFPPELEPRWAERERAVS